MSGNRKFYAYRVDWRDAAGSSGWQWIGDHKAKHYDVHSIGYLLHEDDEYVTLCMSLTSEFQSGDRLQIPQAWITKKTKLKGVSAIEFKHESGPL